MYFVVNVLHVLTVFSVLHDMYSLCMSECVLCARCVSCAPRL